MFDPAEEPTASAERTSGDLASLLLELGRAFKGVGFYAPNDRRAADLLDRAFLAWRIELERGGPLLLQIDERGFRLESSGERIEHPQICELARALLERGVEGIEFGPELERSAFRALVNRLAREPSAETPSHEFERTLRECEGGGIGLFFNGESKQASATQKAAEATGFRSAPAESPASLGAALLSRERTPRLDSDEAFEPEKPSLEEQPLCAAANDARAEPLRARLRELDACADDSAYAFLARRITQSAETLFDEDHRDECYRVMLVLSDHAAGARGRPGLQARIAGERLCELATGARLEDLIERACSSEARASVRASRLLLQIGEPAAGALFERLTRESIDSDRAAQLTAILITLGRAALPVLADAIEAGRGESALLAAHLAGELRDPALLPKLRGALSSPRSGLVREAIRSLVLIGNEDASALLATTLESDDDEVSAAAAAGLGILCDERSLNPLLDALDTALRKGSVKRCRELIRALGQLGSEKAVPRLASLLSRRSWLRRARARELRMQALTALALLPGREARRALERVARGRDRALGSRAIALLGDAGASNSTQPLQ